MCDYRIVLVLAIVSSLCIPDAPIVGQREPVRMRLVGTHTVELSEILRIGSLDGPADAFGLIRGVAFDRARRLYVADYLNHEVRVFVLVGQLLRVIGRHGRGPG